MRKLKVLITSFPSHLKNKTTSVAKNEFHFTTENTHSVLKENGYKKIILYLTVVYSTQRHRGHRVSQRN